jgi:hypothetical protein
MVPAATTPAPTSRPFLKIIRLLRPVGPVTATCFRTDSMFVICSPPVCWVREPSGCRYRQMNFTSDVRAGRHVSQCGRPACNSGCICVQRARGKSSADLSPGVDRIPPASQHRPAAPRPRPARTGPSSHPATATQPRRAPDPAKTSPRRTHERVPDRRLTDPTVDWRDCVFG